MPTHLKYRSTKYAQNSPEKFALSQIKVETSSGTVGTKSGQMAFLSEIIFTADYEWKICQTK